MTARTALQAVVEFFRSSVRSRLAWLFACLHAAWFFLAIANMSPPSPAFADFLDTGGLSTATIFAGRPFHFHYESVLLQILVWADLPSMLVEALLGLVSLPLLMNIRLGHYLVSYLGAGFLLFIATCQWLAVGKSVQEWLSSKSSGDWLLRMLARYFAVTITFILLVTVVSVPLVNQRSQRQGFRHPAVSFRAPK
jgi:hypothetical protein